MTIENVCRINVWPTMAEARAAFDGADGSELCGRMIVWPTTKLAKEYMEEEGGGDAGTPAWVPANAKIHIDFLGGTPQGRAWLDGTGEVAIETLLGFYDSGNLAPGQGLFNNVAMDVAGAALTLMLGSFTARIQYLWPEGTIQDNLDQTFYTKAATGGYEFQFGLHFADMTVHFDAYNEMFLTMNSAPLNKGESADAYDVAAFTFTTIAAGGRAEFAVNGSAVTSGTYDTDDRPAANPLNYARIDLGNLTLQYITIYDPLPTTAGLSALSEVP